MPTRALVVTLLTGSLLGGPLPAQDLVAEPRAGVQSGPSLDRWPIAVTIDDVPMTAGAGCTPAQIASVTKALLAQLRARDIVATAFVIPGTPCQGRAETSATAIAAQWLAAGHAVGNHSWSHRDYNGLPATEYLADVTRAHDALESVLRSAGQGERWYRPPLLHAGNTAGKRAALGDWLAGNDYGMGVVTIDNQEWVFASAYNRATERLADSLAARIRAEYVEHLRENVRYYRALAQQVFGRDIPQVLLLHANQLNANHLDDVLDMLDAEGAEFVSLPEALRDPAYRTEEAYVGPRGLSWLQRWALARGLEVPPEPREPAWIQAVASGAVVSPPPPPPPADTIDAATAAVLDSLNAAFSAAWVRGEGPALAAAYAPAGIVHPPAGGVLVGEERIRRYWAPGGGRAGHRIEPLLRRRLGANHVLEVGRWHSRWLADDGTPDEWAWGCYTVVWERGPSTQWRMLFDGWSLPHTEDWACRPRS